MTPLPYRPHPLLRNGHLQTLMVGLICGERPKYSARPITVPLPDGESMVAHEETGGVHADRAPLVILQHGLGGDHRSPYLERLAPRLSALGFTVWRVDMRGCGAGLPLAWRPANAGSSRDLAAVVRAAAATYPRKRIHVVGFSLSGNVLLKMLGEAAADRPGVEIDLDRIDSAIAIAPPINLSECADNMDRWSRRIYTHYYLKVLHQQVQLRRSQWPQWRRVPEFPSVRTIRQFDARYTAPLSGFVDTADYYEQSSSSPWMKHIRTPTTVLVDRDDPIVTASSFDRTEVNTASTELVFTQRGGHMGYFGLDEQGRMMRWMEYFVMQRFKQLL